MVGFILPLFVAAISSAQVNVTARSVLRQAIDDRSTVKLTGNTRPEATSINDQGVVSSNTRFEHMLLQLRRPPEQQQALETYLRELEDPNSPNFHKFLTAGEFGRRFGLAPQDLDTVTNWLESHGLQVNAVNPNLTIDFSATAAQLHNAFHTQLHQLNIRGKKHVANMADPEIPAALLPAITGVVSLNDFQPYPFSHVSAHQAIAEFTSASGSHPVVPADLGVIYDFNPAFAAGFSGQGQTIAVVEDSDLYSTGDWYVFRKLFGLARPFPKGQLVIAHPASSTGQTCSDPGLNSNGSEATIDAEWASAAAPSATIVVASCTDTFISGALVALQNLLTSGNPPPNVVSISYGMSEAFLGQTQNEFVNSLYQMAVAEGVSIFVAAGDSGAANSDSGSSPAHQGIAVNGFASTPYNVAVGGTDFADGYLNTTSEYWSSTNSPTYKSVLSYVPEITWNASCGSELLASYSGFSTTYGAGGFCNNGGPLNAFSSGGGPSGCASGSPSAGRVVGGTCAGYPKPAWQSVPGNPADGVRDIPDVALFASNRVWGHTLVVCYSASGTPCTGDPSTWSGIGGTSVASPIMAGIQALVNQKTGTNWSNPNKVYYALATPDYASACDATGAPNSACTFHDITLGDTVVPCVGAASCFFSSSPGTYGVLSLSSLTYQPAFKAGQGWDFATGLGSVDVANLLKNWGTAASTP